MYRITTFTDTTAKREEAKYPTLASARNGMALYLKNLNHKYRYKIMWLDKKKPLALVGNVYIQIELVVPDELPPLKDLLKDESYHFHIKTVV